MKEIAARLMICAFVLAAPFHRAQAQDCSWCGIQDAPDSLSWSTQIASLAEPGDRLVVTGTVYHEDGVTLAEGVLIYVY